MEATGADTAVSKASERLQAAAGDWLSLPALRQRLASRPFWLTLAWAAVVAYSVWLAPSTSASNEWRLIRTLCFENAVVFCLQAANVLQVIITACLVMPALTNGERKLVPAWPFVTLSSFVGVAGLLPWMAWMMGPSAARRGSKLPPAKRSLKGAVKLPMRLGETNLLPAALLATASALALLAWSSNTATWRNFWHMAVTTWTVHVALLDGICKHVVIMWALPRDAQARDWKGGRFLMAACSAVPVFGPAAYLLMRPKTYGWWIQ